jgi:hypothetical protein
MARAAAFACRGVASGMAFGATARRDLNAVWRRRASLRSCGISGRQRQAWRFGEIGGVRAAHRAARHSAARNLISAFYLGYLAARRCIGNGEKWAMK